MIRTTASTSSGPTSHDATEECRADPPALVQLSVWRIGNGQVRWSIRVGVTGDDAAVAARAVLNVTATIEDALQARYGRRGRPTRDARGGGVA